VVTGHGHPVAFCRDGPSRLITEESPADESKTAWRAGAKSPLDNPCRETSGGTSLSSGDGRFRAGRFRMRTSASFPASRLLGFSPSHLLLDPPVQHPWGADRTRPGDGLKPLLPGQFVPRDERVSVCVPLTRGLGERGLQWAPRAAGRVFRVPSRPISSRIDRPSPWEVSPRGRSDRRSHLLAKNHRRLSVSFSPDLRQRGQHLPW